MHVWRIFLLAESDVNHNLNGYFLPFVIICAKSNDFVIYYFRICEKKWGRGANNKHLILISTNADVKMSRDIFPP